MLLAVVLAAVNEALHIKSRDEVYLCTHNWTIICQMYVISLGLGLHVNLSTTKFSGNVIPAMSLSTSTDS